MKKERKKLLHKYLFTGREFELPFLTSHSVIKVDKDIVNNVYLHLKKNLSIKNKQVCLQMIK